MESNKFIFKTSILLIAALLFSSCGSNKIPMEELAAYLKAKGYDGELKRDSTFSGGKDSPFSEVYFFSNLHEISDKMRLYGYFLGKESTRKFDFNTDFERICAYKVFKPYALVVGKRNEDYKGLFSMSEDETYKIVMQGYKSRSFYCDETLEKTFSELNKQINDGTFKSENIGTNKQTEVDSNLLIGKAFDNWSSPPTEVEGRKICSAPTKLIANQSGFLWIDTQYPCANAMNIMYTFESESGSLGYALSYFDKNGYLKWQRPPVNPMNAEDQYFLRGYKTSGDTIKLIVHHKYLTYYNAKSDNCFEYYILNIDAITGNTLSKQTLAKHFNPVYKEQFSSMIEDLREAGVDVDEYFSKDDELSSDEESLFQTFLPIGSSTEIKVKNDSYSVSLNKFVNAQSTQGFFLKKNNKEIFSSQSDCIDKYFDELLTFNYCLDMNKFVGIARGKSFFGEQFYYIRTFDLDGKCKPILLKDRK